MAPQSVSITGMGIITPSGLGIDSLWHKCLKQETFIQDGLGRVDQSLVQEMEQKVSLSPWLKNKPSNMGKSLLMSLYALTHALDEADWKSFTPDDVIVIGTTTGQIGLWEEDLLKTTQDQTSSAAALSKQPLYSLPEDLKRSLNFPGRIMVLSSACSASTQSLILGHQLLTSQRAKRVLAGGVEELGQLTINGFGCLKLLNSEPCKPFDQNRAGINLSEGSGFYSLELNSEKKSYASLLGGDTVLDSYHMTSPNPEGSGLEKSILSSLKTAQLKASDIAFIHAHGTGSTHNDQAEAFALHKLFSGSPEVISTKGTHGHALGASGAIEIGICLQVLKEQTIPAVSGLSQRDEAIHLNLPLKNVTKQIPYLLKTTLGFGGVNSSLILKAPHA